MSGATILCGASRHAATLAAALEARDERVIRVAEPAAEADWAAAVRTAQAQTGGIARVINVLTNPVPDATLGSIDLDAFDAAYRATLLRTYIGLRETVPTMRTAGGGRFLTLWVQNDLAEGDALFEPVCLGGLEQCSRVIAKEYAGPPTVNVNLVVCRAAEATPEVLEFWSDYLGTSAGEYVTGANIGRPAH